MKMQQYEVGILANGKFSGAVVVEATDSAMAKRLALAQASSQAGFAGQKVTTSYIRKV